MFYYLIKIRSFFLTFKVIVLVKVNLEEVFYDCKIKNEIIRDILEFCIKNMKIDFFWRCYFEIIINMVFLINS